MAKKNSPNDKANESLGFEPAFDKLQEIVRNLESGKLTLDQSLEQYSQGVTHLRTCYAALERAEQRIRLLMDVDDQGNAVTRPFDHQASTERVDNDD